MAFEPVSGVMGLKWADTIYTTADKVLLACGMWLFEKPFDHFRWQLYAWKRQGLRIARGSSGYRHARRDADGAKCRI